MKNLWRYWHPNRVFMTTQHALPPLAQVAPHAPPIRWSPTPAPVHQGDVPSLPASGSRPSIANPSGCRDGATPYGACGCIGAKGATSTTPPAVPGLGFPGQRWLLRLQDTSVGSSPAWVLAGGRRRKPFDQPLRAWAKGGEKRGRVTGWGVGVRNLESLNTSAGAIPLPALLRKSAWLNQTSNRPSFPSYPS